MLLALTTLGCVGSDDDDGGSSSAQDFAAEVDRPPVAIDQTLAVVYNSPDALAIGPSRLVVKAVTDAGDEYGGPGVDATLVLTGPDQELEVPTTWVWSSEGYSGFYIASVTLETAGSWTARLTSADGKSAPFPFQVNTISIVPAVGQPALASDSKVLGDSVDFEDLTTDPEPNPDFYAMTVAEAVRSGRPSVLVFATPMLCRTAVCGPVLDEMKDLASRLDDVNFVHVEIYEPVDQNDVELIPVPAVVEWQLPSEPWVFVVDADGRVAASFEGFTSADEVLLALTRLS